MKNPLKSNQFCSELQRQTCSSHAVCVNSVYVSVGMEVETEIVGVWSKGLQLEHST